LAAPADGEDVRVFRDDATPAMWQSHPSNADREANAKAQFVPAEADERSPWGLFGDAEIRRERMTHRFCRVVFRVKKTVTLSPAAKVQGFIDDEHAEMTCDPKYAGCYDERPRRLGDFAEVEKLFGCAHDPPYSSFHSSYHAIWMASNTFSLDPSGLPSKPSRSMTHLCMSVNRTVSGSSVSYRSNSNSPTSR